MRAFFQAKLQIDSNWDVNEYCIIYGYVVNSNAG